MKRINLSVMVEDNELFEKSVKDALESYAKQVAREEFQKILTAEIERITTAQINSIKQSPYYNTILTKVTESLAKKLSQDITIGSEQVHSMIEDKVGNYLDGRLQSRGGLERFIQSYIDRSIADALLRNSKD